VRSQRVSSKTTTSPNAMAIVPIIPRPVSGKLPGGVRVGAGVVVAATVPVAWLVPVAVGPGVVGVVVSEVADGDGVCSVGSGVGEGNGVAVSVPGPG
jgi:hypothetical protein